MTKRVHPILKMQRSLFCWNRGTEKERKVIARHVKPLLDELEEMHSVFYDHAIGSSDQCAACRLLADWRAKL